MGSFSIQNLPASQQLWDLKEGIYFPPFPPFFSYAVQHPKWRWACSYLCIAAEVNYSDCIVGHCQYFIKVFKLSELNCLFGSFRRMPFILISLLFLHSVKSTFWFKICAMFLFITKDRGRKGTWNVIVLSSFYPNHRNLGVSQLSFWCRWLQRSTFQSFYISKHLFIQYFSNLSPLLSSS